eukprot:8355238-Karenia_brevis.AAC.1
MPKFASRFGVNEPPPPDRSAKGKGKGTNKSTKKLMTVTSINGQDICKRFNDQRGCKPNCPQG